MRLHEACAWCLEVKAARRLLEDRCLLAEVLVYLAPSVPPEAADLVGPAPVGLQGATAPRARTLLRLAHVEAQAWIQERRHEAGADLAALERLEQGKDHWSCLRLVRVRDGLDLCNSFCSAQRLWVLHQLWLHGRCQGWTHAEADDLGRWIHERKDLDSFWPDRRQIDWTGFPWPKARTLQEPPFVPVY